MGLERFDGNSLLDFMAWAAAEPRLRKTIPQITHRRLFHLNLRPLQAREFSKKPKCMFCTPTYKHFRGVSTPESDLLA